MSRVYRLMGSVDDYFSVSQFVSFKTVCSISFWKCYIYSTIMNFQTESCLLLSFFPHEKIKNSCRKIVIYHFRTFVFSSRNNAPAGPSSRVFRHIGTSIKKSNFLAERCWAATLAPKSWNKFLMAFFWWENTTKFH